MFVFKYKRRVHNDLDADRENARKPAALSDADECGQFFWGSNPGAIKQYSKTSSELCVFTVSTESHVALGQQGL